MSDVPPAAFSVSDIDVGAIRDGERRAFVVLADVWLDRMHDAAQNIVGSAEAAAEICGEVFGRLWRRHADVAPRRSHPGVAAPGHPGRSAVVSRTARMEPSRRWWWRQRW